MDAQQREALYDTEIGPMLLRLANACQTAGLSFVSLVEWSPGEHSMTAALAAGSGPSMRHAVVAARAGSNVDALIMALMKEASIAGHSSMCLKQLGVPEKPEPG
jgi:hypothetical protein